MFYPKQRGEPLSTFLHLSWISFTYIQLFRQNETSKMLLPNFIVSLQLNFSKAENISLLPFEIMFI